MERKYCVGLELTLKFNLSKSIVIWNGEIIHTISQNIKASPPLAKR